MVSVCDCQDTGRACAAIGRELPAKRPQRALRFGNETSSTEISLVGILGTFVIIAVTAAGIVGLLLTHGWVRLGSAALTLLGLAYLIPLLLASFVTALVLAVMRPAKRQVRRGQR